MSVVFAVVRGQFISFLIESPPRPVMSVTFELAGHNSLGSFLHSGAHRVSHVRLEQARIERLVQVIVDEGEKEIRIATYERRELPEITVANQHGRARLAFEHR